MQVYINKGKALCLNSNLLQSITENCFVPRGLAKPEKLLLLNELKLPMLMFIDSPELPVRCLGKIFNLLNNLSI